MEPLYAGIVIAGGCSLAAEEGPLASCETLSAGPSSASFLSGSEEGSLRSGSLEALPVALRSPSLLRLAGSVYAVGGCLGPKRHSAGIYRLTEERGWVSAGELYHGRSCAMGAALSDCEALVLGGWDGRECLASVERLSLRHDGSLKVSPAPPLPTPIKNGAAVTLPSKEAVLLFGGYDGKRTLRTVWRYASSGKSSMAGLLPSPVESAAAVYAPLIDRVLLVGGYDGIGLTPNIVLVHPNTAGSSLSPTSLSVARENHGAGLLGGGSLLGVFAGWDGREALDQVELFRLCPDGPQGPSLESLPSKHRLNERRNRPGYTAMA